MTAETDNYATILMELVKAVKMHNFYPQGHPQLESLIEKAFLNLKKSVDSSGEIKWRVDQRGFYSGKTPFGAGNAEITGMAKKLFFRKVREIAFSREVRPSDLKVFISAMNAEPEEIQSQGGVEAFFARLGIEGILLNEQNYDDLRKLKSEIQEKQEEKTVTDEHESQPGMSEQSKDEEKEEKPQEEAREEPLDELVERIRAEDDLLRYRDLAARIREKVEGLLGEGRHDEAFPVLVAFYEHSDKYSGKSDAVKETANEALKGLMAPEVLKYLAARAGSNDEANRWAVQGMLFSTGAAGAGALLDEIISAPEAAARRNLFNALVLFGPSLRPLAEARLDNPEWYVTRQMAALLGEIGGEEALPALESAYGSSEPRVKKEVLKSMVKIGGGRVTGFMLKVLNDDNQSIVAQAIISLGALKDASAVDALKDIAFKREHPEASREAVKALGMIGDPSAVPHLRKILSRKVWFGKRANEEMRSLAALSLGMIGIPEAITAVEDVFADSTGELHMACKRVLDGRGKTR